MSIDPKLIPILIVTLILWGGVFMYLLRVDILTRQVQKYFDEKIEDRKSEDD